MEFLKSGRYDSSLINENMMGPNSMKMLEEILGENGLKPGMRVLDLGCGRGLTSIFLAREYGVQVFAVDLWITATDNYRRFREQGLDERIIPLHANALDLPFADEYFDALISIDSYHYFGRDEAYFDSRLAGMLKKDALIAIGVPGFRHEVKENIPEEMKPYWFDEVIETIHSAEWWRKVFSASEHFDLKEIREMECFEEAWHDWLATDNEYAVSDRPMMAADGGRYMNLLSIVGKKK
ncbi:SAM-dependent methyltransferase [Anaerobium acetethylicum]|uniref:Cyclopropane fatty-acyl-phospholipid synthase n=1 Tax=Anaerobium acetethylicum TaxID=1619234 RepID=A0A1D3TZI5_9FIRM|nr:methyltransferase domain-containing protein [Anaerobium acetethylicum]SCQ00004.1 Cyclopropane fatty-acyl-phospholipid synthase [Anaerobium acetethylicum]